MKIFLNKFYNNAPVFIQNIIISLYGYKLKKQRYGFFYKTKFKQILGKTHLSLADEIKNQNEKLVDFLSFTINHSPYYREKYKNLDISNVKGVADLHLLPIITKEELRSNINDVYTIKKNESIKSFTGGTTGKSLEVLFSISDFQERMAYLDAFKYKLGIDPFLTRKATFSGREIIGTRFNSNKIFWRYNAVYNQKLYSTFHINEKNMPFYINDLNKFKPEVINGFVSAIYEVAKYIKSSKVNLEFTPKAIFTTSETLLDFHRILIEQVFGTHIYNQYASAEGAPFITECLKGELHYNLDTGVIEQKINSDSILVTSFTTHGTPLIRYDIGDQVKFKCGECSCGSKHPLVEEIKGRMVDYLESFDGNKVSLSHLADVIKGMPSCIKKVQFVQTKKNLIIIKIVVDTNYIKEYDKYLIDSMTYRFGMLTDFIIEKVSEIPREKSGKYLLIKNEYLKNKQI